MTFARLVLYCAGWSSERVSTTKDGDDELAVVVTGCDSGFGKDLAFQLATNGFRVFAGCLRKDSFEQYKDHDFITPVVLDVTKDQDATECARLVDSWIAGSSGVGAKKKKKNRRYLHAVVNNAGYGTGGLVDWVGVDDFKVCMDINCYGIVRTVKAFLPRLKKQSVVHSADEYYGHARIINVTSIAGVVSSGFLSPYIASKHAAEALSHCLRVELRDFGIPVVTVNPSFHETPLTHDMGGVAVKRWNRLDPQQRDEYGQEYFNEVVLKMFTLPKNSMWRPQTATQQLTDAVELVRPPSKMMVGLDAKFSFMVLRMCPLWLSDSFIPDFGVRPQMLEKRPKAD